MTARVGAPRSSPPIAPGPPVPPPLPPGRLLDVPGRGEMLVRDLPAAGAVRTPPILLLHGWTLSADVNWFALYPGLAALDWLLRVGALRRPTERFLRLAAGKNPDLVAVLPWLAAEGFRGDPEDIAEAGRALGGFDARSWASEVDVPTAVVVSAEDRLLGAERQWELARAVPDARAVELAAGHNGWLVHPDLVGDALRRAIALVLGRLGARRRAFGQPA